MKKKGRNTLWQARAFSIFCSAAGGRGAGYVFLSSTFRIGLRQKEKKQMQGTRSCWALLRAFMARVQPTYHCFLAISEILK